MEGPRGSGGHGRDARLERGDLRDEFLVLILALSQSGPDSIVLGSAVVVLICAPTRWKIIFTPAAPK